MGLFEDDFYSTKITKRSVRTAKDSGWGLRRSKQRTGLSTLQISPVSSVLSVIVTVLLISFISGNPFSTRGGSSASAGAGDPYDRISQAASRLDLL